MNDNQKEFLGLSFGCLAWIGLVIVLVLGSVAFTVWYNYNLAIPLENSERHVVECSRSYMVSQEARISNDLDAISRNTVAIDATSSEGLKEGLRFQQKTNADDIYNALDAAHCSRSQIIQEMPELSSFFSQFPTR